MSSSNEKLLELAGQAVNWLHALAPSHSESKKIHKLADELSDCVKGCPSCGSKNRLCPCERDE